MRQGNVIDEHRYRVWWSILLLQHSPCWHPLSLPAPTYLLTTLAFYTLFPCALSAPPFGPLPKLELSVNCVYRHLRTPTYVSLPLRVRRSPVLSFSA